MDDKPELKAVDDGAKIDAAIDAKAADPAADDAKAVKAEAQAEDKTEATDPSLTPPTQAERDAALRAEFQARAEAERMKEEAAAAEAAAIAKAEAEANTPQASLKSRAAAEIEGANVPVGHEVIVDDALHALPLFPLAVDANGRLWKFVEGDEDQPTRVVCVGRVVV